MKRVTQIQHQMIGALRAVLTIAESPTVTAPVELYGTTAIGLMTPDGLGSTALSFLVSADGINYVQLCDIENKPITFTVGKSAKAYPLLPNTFAAWRYLKIVCNAAETADKTFTLIPFSI